MSDAPETPSTAPGDRTSWVKPARAWIAAQLKDRPLHIEVVRQRGWGDIWRVHSPGRALWFKRGHPQLHGEVALRGVLERYASPWVLPLVAAHPDHGWMLTEDQGPPLHTLSESDPDGGRQARRDLARAVAHVQQAVSLAELRTLDLPVLSPDQAVQNLDRALTWYAGLSYNHPCHVDDAQRNAALRAMERLVQQWEGRIPPPGVPALGIDHNDVHLGNAFPGPLISDWGDAVLGHPFGSIRHLMVTAHRAHGRDEAESLRSTYLKCWGDPDELQETFELAVRLAVPNRLHCWWRLDDPDLVAQYATYVLPLIDEIGQGWDEITEP